MNTGVEILLQRMKDCPEDFEYNITKNGMSRWLRLVDHAIGDELLTLEEHEAIKAGMKEVKRNKFTEMVMKELAGEGEPSDEGKSLTSNTGMGGQTHAQSMAIQKAYLAQQQAAIQQAQYAQQALANQYHGAGQNAYQSGAGLTSSATWANTQASLTLGDTTLSEAGLKQMLATHKAMREQAKSKHWWNKSLPELFGKK